MRRALGSAVIAVASVCSLDIAAIAGRDGNELPPAVELFLANGGGGPTTYRALRRFEVRSGRLSDVAWMEVWTEADDEGFSYQVAASGGSGLVRDRVFLPALEAERAMWGRGERGAITPENYVFEDRGVDPDGLAWIGITPRRKDVVLVKGAIFLGRSDGDLVRVEGVLAKTPSFWTRKVEIVRRYDRIAGVRVPVIFESVASILFAGRSTFRMMYEYESINGQAIDRPASK